MYCVAGGTSTEIGFLTDIDAEKLESSRIHLHDPLCLPLQLHLAGLPRGAEIETASDETDRRLDGIDGAAGAPISFRGESGARDRCRCGEGRFCALRGLDGVGLAFREHDRSFAQERAWCPGLVVGDSCGFVRLACFETPLGQNVQTRWNTQ